MYERHSGAEPFVTRHRGAPDWDSRCWWTAVQLLIINGLIGDSHQQSFTSKWQHGIMRYLHARLPSPGNALPLSKEAAFADNTAGNTSPPPPFRRPGEVAEERKEEVGHA
jgi:hypothetical protein